MITRTCLSDAARVRLVAFCAENLRPELPHARYADWLEGNLDNWNNGPVYFEIRGRDTQTGNPVTITFSDDADFRTEEVE